MMEEERRTDVGAELKCGVRVESSRVLIQRSEELPFAWEGAVDLRHEGNEQVRVVTKVWKGRRFRGCPVVKERGPIQPGEGRKHWIRFPPSIPLNLVPHTHLVLFFYSHHHHEERLDLRFEVPEGLIEQGEEEEVRLLRTPVGTPVQIRGSRHEYRGEGDGICPETTTEGEGGPEVEDEEILLAMKDTFLLAAHSCHPNANWFRNVGKEPRLRDFDEESLLEKVVARVCEGLWREGGEEGGSGEGGRLTAGASPISPKGQIHHPHEVWLDVEVIQGPNDESTNSEERSALEPGYGEGDGMRCSAEKPSEVWMKSPYWMVALSFCVGFFVARKVVRN